MDDDWRQLERYLARGEGSDEAFAVIVERHLGLVFSAARRQLNDPAAAEEVTQAVFVLLVQKAPALRPVGSLGAWLYSAASLKAKERLRSDLARKKRERKAHEMASDDLPDEGGELDWGRVAPLLDTAMGELREGDREALLMRYFQGRPLREVGETLGVSEDAARKRVSRAVERLRSWFAERGVAFSAGALVAALPLRGVEAVPADLLGDTLAAVAAESTTGAVGGTAAAAAASGKVTAIAAALVGAAVPISIGLFTAGPDPLRVPVAAAVPDPIAIPPPQDSELMAEWKRLRSTFGPEAGSMPELYMAIDEIDDGFRRRVFRNALIAEWVRVDGEGAVAFLRGDHKEMLDQLFGEWIETDPAAAIAALVSGGGEFTRAIEANIERIAEVSPASLAQLAPLVEKRRPWDLHVQKAFAAFARSDFGAARAVAGSLGGDAAGEAVAGVAAVWGERDGREAFAWVRGLTDKAVRDRAMQALLVGWAKQDPLAALEKLKHAPAGGGAQFSSGWSTASRVVEAAAESDFEATLQWVVENERAPHDPNSGIEGLRSVLLQRFLRDVAGTLEAAAGHPAKAILQPAIHNLLLNDGFAKRDEVWAWLEAQPESEFADQMRMSLIRSAAWRRPEVAIGWIDSTPPGEFDAADYERLANSLLNGGNAADRIEGLLDRVGSGPLRESLMQVALWHADANIDVGAWVGRLGEFPLERRPDAVSRVAAAWSQSDPAAAVAWAEGLGADRAKAYEGIAGGWAEADSWEASDWVAGLAEGAERDAAIIGMVGRIAAAQPDAAWQWAGAVGDEGERQRAMQAVIDQVRRRQPERALRLLDEAQLSAEIDGSLRRMIEHQTAGGLGR